VLVLLVSKADTKEAAQAGGFDPPLVRGQDGHYYFALRARDPYGETGTLYIPADVHDSYTGTFYVPTDEHDKELTYLDAQGKRRLLRIGHDDLADHGSVEGRFVKFRAFKHALTFEARYRGETVYIPVPGRWYRDEEDHYGRWVFTVRAAEGEPDSRYLKNYKLDMFLRGQTYHYKTQKEITGGAGSGAIGALGGLALLGGWLVTATMILGMIMWVTSNKINEAISSDGGYLALFGLISAITVGVTIWAIYSAHQEKSPYYINQVPDVTSPRENTARRGSESPPRRRDDELPYYIG
jgi:hypothetical protein